MMGVAAACLAALACIVVVAVTHTGSDEVALADHTSHDVAAAILDKATGHKAAKGVPLAIAKTAEEAAAEVQHGLKATAKLPALSPALEKMLKQAQSEISIEKKVKAAHNTAAKHKAAAKKAK